MKTTEPRTIHLKDYRAPAYKIPEIFLEFVLDPDATRVRATMKVVRSAPSAEPLDLNGKNLRLVSVQVDGRQLEASEYNADPETLTIHAPPASFTLFVETEIAPASNTALEGLYMASGIFCTQCEPEGFRAITYYLDRPDNLAIFETRIDAPRGKFPTLLSNGNLVETGETENGWHFARWHDPFPKPSYLFALVAGDLGCLEDSYTTGSGRKIDLKVFVEHGNEERAEYAMDSLKRSMRWDEEAYGREYDLDIFMVVAVSAFNFGAMENKGLNVFNDKLVLASPETATDDDYARIECVVGHEYFHNWTGNRITCRDWFQLSLKEGLTVFRESQFAGDMRSHAVRRISDVKMLRLRQFQEDGGPLAHPVQPQSYIAIDNFYTATVYEKGAEVIGMLKTIVGAENFRKGMDLYFERHDGDAATVEDFVRCFEEISARDLTQFRRWYVQAGTPEVRAEGRYDAAEKSYRLTLAQKLAPTPGQPVKLPAHMPIRLGLIGKETQKPLPLTLRGENTQGPDERVLELHDATHEFVFDGIEEEPVLSLGRGFSAPAHFVDGNGRAEKSFLLRHDTDSFNRWDAGQYLATDVLLEMVAAIKESRTPSIDPLYIEAIGGVLERASEDPALAALMLLPPGESEIALAMTEIDPHAIYLARRTLIREAATAHGDGMMKVYTATQLSGPFSPSAADAGKRALRNAALRYVTAADDEAAALLAHEHYATVSNMTDKIAGLAALSRIGGEHYETALADFFDEFEFDPLVLDKWMGVQAMSPREDTVERVRKLMTHRAFSMKNPNRVRALIGAFANGNPLRFHDASGSGYRLLAEVIEELDEINPQTAARMTTAFENWRRYDEPRQKLMKAELESLAAGKSISPNLYEIVAKILGSNEG